MRKTFEFYYEYCKKYYEEHGNLNIPEKYVVDDVKLGQWVVYQRRHKEKCTKEHKDMLDALEFPWISGHSWEFNFELYKEYISTHGSSDIKQQLVYKGCALGEWVFAQKKKFADGKLAKKKIEKLESVDFCFRPKQIQSYEQKLSLFKQYYLEHGHLLPKITEIYKGQEIGKYVAQYRRTYIHGEMAPERVKELESAGMEWDARRAYWQLQYDLCMEYLDFEGDIKAATVYDGHRIGRWVVRQKDALKKGTVDEWKLPLLEELFEKNPVISRWERGYSYAKEYYKEHKNLDVEAPYYKNFCLKRWLIYQRNRQKKGDLPLERFQKLDELGMNW